MKVTNQNLTRDEWMKLWDDGGWKSTVAETCYEVANSNHAHPVDRELALGVLGSLVLLGATLPDSRPFPQIIRDIQLAIVRGGAKPNKTTRAQLTERMDGVKWTLSTISQFVDVQALLDNVKMLEEKRHNNTVSN